MPFTDNHNVEKEPLMAPPDDTADYLDRVTGRRSPRTSPRQSPSARTRVTGPLSGEYKKALDASNSNRASLGTTAMAIVSVPTDEQPQRPLPPTAPPVVSTESRLSLASRIVLGGLSAGLAALGLVMFVAFLVGLDDVRILWPSAYYGLLVGASFLLLAGLSGVFGNYFRLESLRISSFLCLLAVWFCCCAAFILTASMHPSDHEIRAQWEAQVRAQGDVMCDVELRRGCTGWSFPCPNQSINATVSPASSVQCPANCVLPHNTTRTCESWFRSSLAEAKPSMTGAILGATFVLVLTGAVLYVNRRAAAIAAAENAGSVPSVAAAVPAA